MHRQAVRGRPWLGTIGVMGSSRLEPRSGSESSASFEEVTEVSRRTYKTIQEWVAAGRPDPQTGLNLRDALRYRLFEEINGPAGEEIARATRLSE